MAEIIRRVRSVVQGQMTMDGRGGLIFTPSVSIGGTRVGKFALSNGSVQVGFRKTFGAMGGRGVLYPVDTSRLDRGTTITIIRR